MNSFAKLKQNFSLEKLAESVKKMTDKKTYEDSNNENFWQPTVDKTGTGYAIIRFLPTSENDNDPWIKLYTHGFQSNGGWYIENCPTTIGEKCPVCQSNSTMWNSGIEANKEIVRQQKRKLTYIANVLIIKDPENPSNEGQVKMFKFGKKIFEKIMDAINPKFHDQEPINPLDFWHGANFRLRICKVDGYRNYDKSEFDRPSMLYDGDDVKLEELWKSQFCLSDLVKPSVFKSYEELEERFQRVIGNDVPTTKVTDHSYDSYEKEENYYDSKPTFNRREAAPPTAPVVPTQPSKKIDDVDDELSEFTSLLDN